MQRRNRDYRQLMEQISNVISYILFVLAIVRMINAITVALSGSSNFITCIIEAITLILMCDNERDLNTISCLVVYVVKMFDEHFNK